MLTDSRTRKVVGRRFFFLMSSAVTMTVNPRLRIFFNVLRYIKIVIFDIIPILDTRVSFLEVCQFFSTCLRSMLKYLS